MFEFHKRHARSSRHDAGFHGRAGDLLFFAKAPGENRTRREAAASGACPLCENHCPLSDVGCGKGAAYRNGSRAIQEIPMKTDRLNEPDDMTAPHSMWPGGIPTDAMRPDAMPPDGAADGEGLSALFHRAAKFMMRMHHHQGHAEHAQMRILAILMHHEPMNQKDLLEMLHVRSASLSEILAKLEHRGLISRSRDERDKRSAVITLTGQGRVLAAEGGEARKQGMGAVFGALSESEREQFAGLLRKVIDSLEQHVPDHHGRHGHERGRGHMRGHCGRHMHEHGGREGFGRHSHERGRDGERHCGRGRPGEEHRSPDRDHQDGDHPDEKRPDSKHAGEKHPGGRRRGHDGL